jgi:hypothetical protein
VQRVLDLCPVPVLVPSTNGSVYPMLSPQYFPS